MRNADALFEHRYDALLLCSHCSSTLQEMTLPLQGRCETVDVNTARMRRTPWDRRWRTRAAA